MVSDQADFRRQRRIGLTAIAIAMPVATVLWLAFTFLLPPLTAMDTIADRMLLTLKCACFAVLFCVVTGVEAVAHERLVSPAFDPLVGFATRRLRVNERYLANTVEQTLIFIPGLFGLAAYATGGAAMRSVVASAIVWILGRFAFWIGYHRSAALRGLGAPSMALGMALLLYVAARTGFDIAGTVGAAVPIIVFLIIEAALFRTTLTPSAANQDTSRHGH